MGKIDYKKSRLALFIYIGVAMIFAGLALLFFSGNGNSPDIMTWVWGGLCICLLLATAQESLTTIRLGRIIKFGKHYNAKIVGLVSKKMSFGRSVYGVKVRFETDDQKTIELVSRFSIAPNEAPHFTKDNNIAIIYLEITNEFTY